MNTPTDPNVELNNDEPIHRQALIQALQSQGLDAYEYNSGGGTMHVCVDLVDGEASPDELLQITTGSADSPCDVGIMGYSASGQAQSPDFIRTPTLEDAVSAFKDCYRERDQWVERLRAGELNT